VQRIAWYFIPWVIVIVPYYALSAHLKAMWSFHWVFAADIAVIIVSAAVLLVEHSDITALPIAYAAGYGSAGLALLLRRGWRRVPSLPTPPAGILPGMTGQYLAMQIGNVAGLVDRFFQSYLLPGGISALGYSALIVNNMSSLLTFREIYVVPLSNELGRGDRLVRILQGEMFLAIPCAFFFIGYAEAIIAVLFQRGNFSAVDVAFAASVVRIQALSLFVSPLTSPLERIFQILGRVRFTQIRYLSSLIGTLLFQYIFVFVLGFDVQGIAWAGICSGIAVLATVAVMVRRCGIDLRWEKVAGSALFAAAISGGAIAVSLYCSSAFSGFMALAIGGSVYGAIVAAGYFVIRRRLRLITG
jgi:putative peptidoglycan lipid II flippase